MKFTKDIIKDLFWGEVPSNEYEIVSEGEWTHSGGSDDEYKSVIFKFQNKFYEISNTRSGSPWTDWYYGKWDNEVDCDEVELVEKITYEWVSI